MGRWSRYGGRRKKELVGGKERIEGRVEESLLMLVMSSLSLLLKLKAELAKFLLFRGRKGSEWDDWRRLKCLWWSRRS